LGYARPDRFALKEYLGSKGVSVADMIEAGLLIAGDDIPVPYDRFRDRVIIPIHDQRGRIVAFGGRVLNPDAQPKYLNSPETSLFQKGSVVFNFHRARQPAHQDGSVVVVEGYLDAISIYQAGLKSVVATMGTAFTEEQIQTLWRLSSEPVVCFDADRAGISAAHRSIDRILPVLTVGRTFRFAFIQSGKDPDELIRDKGIDAFKEVLSGSLPLWDVLWARELSNAKLDSPDARAALEHKLNAIIRTIKDPMVHTAYHRTCRVDLSELFWQSTKGGKGKSERSKENVKSKLIIEKEGHRHGLQKVLLGTLVHYPEFVDGKTEAIVHIIFSDVLEEFCKSLYALLIMYEKLDVQLIYDRLSPRFYEVLQDIHGDRTDKRPRGYQLFRRFPILACDPPLEFVDECIDHFIHVLHIEQMVDELNKLKVEPVEEHDSDAVSERLTSLVREIQLQKERANNRDVELAEEGTKYRRPILESPLSAASSKMLTTA
jgi:DNA primase